MSNKYLLSIVSLLFLLLLPCCAPLNDGIALRDPIPYLLEAIDHPIDHKGKHLPSTAAPLPKDGEKYEIRTRIVIEQKMYQDPETKQKYIVEVSDEFIRDSFAQANVIYAKIGVHFTIMKKEYRIYDKNISDKNQELLDLDVYLEDAKKFPDYMSVYFVHPGHPGWRVMNGFSMMPWVQKYSYGIIIAENPFITDSYCLAHEIGHYFGLLHTFEKDDLVNDTPTQVKTNIMINEDKTNEDNVMNYSNKQIQKLTPGQYERFLFFLRTTRKNTIITNPVIPVQLYNPELHPQPQSQPKEDWSGPPLTETIKEKFEEILKP